jgi:hypothetical protein
MAKTVIQYARELIESVGEEAAIKVFEKRIEELGHPKNFEEFSKLSGWETAIKFIKGEI